MHTKKIAIIGSGHMGSSLLGGLINHGYPSNQLFLADLSTEKLEQAKEKWNVSIFTDNIKAAENANVIILAVKPDLIAPIAKELASLVQKNKPLIISVAAGITENIIQNALGGNIPIIRSMPNTPALIGYGATGLFANQHTSLEQRQLAETILSSVGIVVWVQTEDQMNAVTALSGSGPAYFYLLIEAMQTAGEKLGLPPEISRTLTLQTALGASQLANSTNKPASELRQQAMTPGGTTEQAIRVFEENQFRQIVLDALTAAKNRAEQLAIKQ